ncbi:unnamed protein product [Brassicogethes aeneus]|uniref:Small ribosomal subunit protein mS23 n=1 Tax=Brassicogethes aeneus TaxID=1431903 RepID=A0A9P0BI71_BRAAE|nr:unnamed protein product [Brassicogethes aeneus]
MAGSRLEKIGSIYSRTSGLIRSGALSWEDRPLWYDVYEAFPPKEEPKFDRPAPNMRLKTIFYKEDKARALFHQNNRQIGAGVLTNNTTKSLTQRFIETYEKLEEQTQGSESMESLYKQAIDMLNRERNTRQTSEGSEEVSLSNAFKKAQKTLVQQEDAPKINVKVSDIFKD